MPKLSIVIPVYNTRKFLPRCLESILGQTYKDYEILLVDDGSTDGSGAICKEYEARDQRIRLIQKENGGVSSARNGGISEAKGDFLLFCDSDDYYQEDFLSTLMEKAEELVDLLFFHFTVKDSGGERQIFQPGIKTLIENPSNFMHLYRKSSGKMKNQVFIDESIAVYIWRILWKREFILKHELRFQEDVSSGEDRLFLMQALLYKPQMDVADDVFGYIYCIRGAESLTGTKNLIRYVPELYWNIQRFDAHEQEICRRSDCLSKADLRRIRLERAKKMHILVITNEMKNNRSHARENIRAFRKTEFFRYAYRWSSFPFFIKECGKREIVKWLLVKLWWH